MESTRRRSGIGRGLGAAASLLTAVLLACGGPPAGAPPSPAGPAGGADLRPDAVVGGSGPPGAGVRLDTVRAGRFDHGKMWTFEDPPVDYFAEEYGFRPDEAWFEHARLGALRIPGCSASFVSATGLVMTNHHCARESLTALDGGEEETLLRGFYARSLDAERPTEAMHADRLVEIRDVSDRISDALEGTSGEERAERRERVLGSVEEEILREYGGEDAGYVVETVSLYDGGRHSAYVFRRYDDVRLVMAPELLIGFFGGDPDNFTYPRYSLDVAFYRIYGDDGEPLEVEHHFAWGGESGVSRGDVVFVVGNPGSTSRHQTVAQLAFRRDVSDAGLLDFLQSRLELVDEFQREHPREAAARDLGNTLFSLTNSRKAYEGMLDGLRDPVILARRLDAQERFVDSLRADPALREEYGDLVDEMAALQDRKRELAGGYRAFVALTSEELASSTLRRALYARQILSLRERGVPDRSLGGMRSAYLSVGDLPAELDEALMAARFRDVAEAFGEDGEVASSLLQGRTAEGLSAVIRDGSALTDSAGAARALDGDAALRDDPAVRAVGAYFPTFIDFQTMLSRIGPQEEELAARLGRARFEVYGTSVPPDATFSLRIADGVVDGYDYNGTRAPALTTFHGLYDHFHGYADEGEDSPWHLPDRWRERPEELDLATPLNFVSTADITGGNSGSPVLDRDLRVVGMVFDGNIESLPGDYIYLPQVARAVAVDARGIQEALDDVYDMDRIVLELTRGRLVETEEEADRVLDDAEPPDSRTLEGR